MFVSPVLAYFAYIGSQGSTNLLIVWTVLGLVLAFGGVVGWALCLCANDQKTLSIIRPSLITARKISFPNMVDIGCFLFYSWNGWWFLAVAEILQLCIIKMIAYFTPLENSQHEPTNNR